MKVVPHNNTVLCRCLNSSQTEEYDGVLFQKENLPLYEVILIGENVQKIDLKVGDVIVASSQPTKLVLDGIILFLIHDEHIAGKVKQ